MRHASRHTSCGPRCTSGRLAGRLDASSVASLGLSHLSHWMRTPVHVGRVRVPCCVLCTEPCRTTATRRILHTGGGPRCMSGSEVGQTGCVKRCVSCAEPSGTRVTRRSLHTGHATGCSGGGVHTTSEVCFTLGVRCGSSVKGAGDGDVSRGCHPVVTCLTFHVDPRDGTFICVSLLQAPGCGTVT